MPVGGAHEKYVGGVENRDYISAVLLNIQETGLFNRLNYLSSSLFLD